ncbi:Uncharacterized protein FKW44_004022 [Caligus rogercresseyi]|uniref:Cytochrome P450 n=1 Tax=Caligus rogercresseyi TaxID=217165 RepID=A0A7T8KAC8_CALRO|nr:Uncharacterized protein FKW44_004022 [Caligus rogercresseyi]
MLIRRTVSTATKASRQIPYPSLRDLVKKRPPHLRLRCSKEAYGDIYKFKIPMGPEAVMLFDPNDAEIVYRSAGKWPNRPGFLALEEFRSSNPLYTNAAGLLSSQGEPWHDFRAKVQTALLRPQNIRAYHDRVDAVAKDFIEDVFIKTLGEDGRATPDLIQHLYQWGLESTGVLAFDRRLGVLSTELQIIDLVQKIFSLSQSLERNLIWKYIGSLLPNYRKMVQCFEQNGVPCKEIERNTLDAGSSVIGNLYKAGCDSNVLCVLALDMLMAGVDTAANQIAFAFYFIAQNPRVQEKLASYLMATLREVLRVRPTAYVNTRICDMPVQLKDFTIEEGNMVLFCHIVMCHDPRFVNEPEEFRPERYIKSSPLYERLQPFTSLPFGHGPRVCVGRRFANLEMCLLLARVLSKYRLELTPEPLKITVPLLMKPEESEEWRTRLAMDNNNCGIQSFFII